MPDSCYLDCFLEDFQVEGWEQNEGEHGAVLAGCNYVGSQCEELCYGEQGRKDRCGLGTSVPVTGISGRLGTVQRRDGPDLPDRSQSHYCCCETAKAFFHAFVFICWSHMWSVTLRFFVLVCILTVVC